MTGTEFKQIRKDLGEAIGRDLSAADMVKLCGLPAGSTDTILRWEVTGPSGPASELLRILAMASDRHPILENFNYSTGGTCRKKSAPRAALNFAKAWATRCAAGSAKAALRLRAQ